MARPHLGAMPRGYVGGGYSPGRLRRVWEEGEVPLEAALSGLEAARLPEA